MKRINFDNIKERNDYLISDFIGGIEMEFIKNGDKYLIKGSNGIIVDEKEKLQLEKKELVLQDISSNNCQEKTTRKIKKINKKLKEVKEEEKADSLDVNTIEETDRVI